MPSETLRICVDRVLPTELLIPAAEKALEENPDNAGTFTVRPGPGAPARGPLRMALVTGRKWMPGRTLRVGFMGGDAFVQNKVKDYAKQWSGYANLGLEFVNDPNADIRVAFQPGEGSWSWIGTEALVIPKNEPTMNLGWLTRGTPDEEYSRVVLHEFGHALGCLHEHQNPAASIKWNKPAVYRYYMGPPNNWPKADVDGNLFDTYARSKTQFTDFDPESIMIYAIPPEHTLDGYSVSSNEVLSRTDIDFIGKMYPFAARPAAATLTVGGAATPAEIGAAGEVDVFQFTIARAGRYVIETSGNTDVVMTLFSAADPTRPMAEDDDGGFGTNAKIATELVAGSYTVRVRHYGTTGTGAYSIAVRAEGAGAARRRRPRRRTRRRARRRARRRRAPRGRGRRQGRRRALRHARRGAGRRPRRSAQRGVE